MAYQWKSLTDGGRISGCGVPSPPTTQKIRVDVLSASPDSYWLVESRYESEYLYILKSYNHMYAVKVSDFSIWPPACSQTCHP